MIYSIAITTEKTTYPKGSPKKTILKLDYGTIHQVEVEFPSGCNALVGVQVKQGLHQVYPSNPAGFFTGDDTKISFRENYMLKAAPFEFDIWTWNDDTAYDHTILFRMGLLREYLGRKITSLQGLIDLDS